MPVPFLQQTSANAAFITELGDLGPIAQRVLDSAVIKRQSASSRAGRGRKRAQGISAGSLPGGAEIASAAAGEGFGKGFCRPWRKAGLAPRIEDSETIRGD